jgi:hypothetical protein
MPGPERAARQLVARQTDGRPNPHNPMAATARKTSSGDRPAAPQKPARGTLTKDFGGTRNNGRHYRFNPTDPCRDGNNGCIDPAPF